MNAPGKFVAQEKYNRWWLDKRVRLEHEVGDYKTVARVELIGPPSFVYGIVKLHFTDGTEKHVQTRRFTPIVSDVEVHPDDKPKRVQKKEKTNG